MCRYSFPVSIYFNVTHDTEYHAADIVDFSGKTWNKLYFMCLYTEPHNADL